MLEVYTDSRFAVLVLPIFLSACPSTSRVSYAMHGSVRRRLRTYLARLPGIGRTVQLLRPCTRSPSQLARLWTSVASVLTYTRVFINAFASIHVKVASMFAYSHAATNAFATIYFNMASSFTYVHIFIEHTSSSCWSSSSGLPRSSSTARC